MSARDKQRARVYRAEAAVVRVRLDQEGDLELVTPTEARQLVRAVSAIVGVSSPKVVVRRGGTRSMYDPVGKRIRLMPFLSGGKQKVAKGSVLHELAHHIARCREGGSMEAEAHGPEFARVCAALYTLCGLDPHGAIFREFQANKVKLF